MRTHCRPKARLAAGDALLLVDVQNDLLSGGSVAVPSGDNVVPVLNRYLAEFAGRQLPIFAIRDWHPEKHCSFRPLGGQWPAHCVADSTGAQFPAELILPPWTVVISKGIAPDQEACSGFEGTDLERRLRGYGLQRLFVGGLATDYGVLHTVKHGLARGFSVFLLSDAIRAMNVKPADGCDAEAEMLRLGAVPIQLDDLAE